MPKLGRIRRNTKSIRTKIIQKVVRKWCGENGRGRKPPFYAFSRRAWMLQIPPSPLYENRRDYPFVQRSHKDSLSCFHKGLRPLRHTSCAPARNEPACVQCFASSAYRLSPDECEKRMSYVRKRPRTFLPHSPGSLLA